MDNLVSFVSQYGYYYLIAISSIAVIVTIADKMLARMHAWRVPERTLLLISALGGSVAMLLTMLIIRHKTRHPKFMVGIPVIIVIQAAIAVFFFLIINKIVSFY